MKVVELADIMSLCTILGNDRKKVPGIIVKSSSKKREKKGESYAIADRTIWTDTTSGRKNP